MRKRSASDLDGNRVTALRCAFFFGNLAVILFMLYVILCNRRDRQFAAASTPSDQNNQAV